MYQEFLNEEIILVKMLKDCGGVLFYSSLPLPLNNPLFIYEVPHAEILLHKTSPFSEMFCVSRERSSMYRHRAHKSLHSSIPYWGTYFMQNIPLAILKNTEALYQALHPTAHMTSWCLLTSWCHDHTPEPHLCTSQVAWKGISGGRRMCSCPVQCMRLWHDSPCELYTTALYWGWTKN